MTAPDSIRPTDAEIIDGKRVVEDARRHFTGLRRRTALSMLLAPPKPKKRMSLKHQRRVCAFRDDYLLKVIAAKPSGSA